MAPSHQALGLGKTVIATSVTLGSVAIASTNGALAQVIPDDTLGSESSRVAPIDALNQRIDGGALRDKVLFHSFQEFGVPEGSGVIFSNPDGVGNILSRVTGENPSNIDGRLGVDGPADLFLLNPHGVIFGPDARLEMSGDFVASTADSYVLPDGSEFSATNPGAAPLLDISDVDVPIGLRFENGAPAPVVNEGTLEVAESQNLALVGGTVVSSGTISAPGGDVAVLSVEGATDTTLPVVEVGSDAQGEFYVRRAAIVNGAVAVAPPSMTAPDVAMEWSVERGDIALQQLTADEGVVSAANSLQLNGSQLETAEDLLLEAKDSVVMRDRPDQPFGVLAGGELRVRGEEAIDIFTLNHPESGLFSGGDMVFQSANPVGGDAHFSTGGNFQIEDLDENFGDLNSPNDPVIRANGDVSLESYEGASLHILAGGSVRIPGGVQITGIDNTHGQQETVTLADGTTIDIDGKERPTLDIRAGIDWDTLPGNSIEGTTQPSSPVFNEATSANIAVGDIAINHGGRRGQILLTNQYQPNLELASGNIDIGSLDSNIFSQGSSVDVFARGNITLARNADDNLANGVSLAGASDTTIDLNAIGDINLESGFYLAGKSINIFSEGDFNASSGRMLSNVDLNRISDVGEIHIRAKNVRISDGVIIQTFSDFDPPVLEEIKEMIAQGQLEPEQLDTSEIIIEADSDIIFLDQSQVTASTRNTPGSISAITLDAGGSIIFENSSSVNNFANVGSTGTSNQISVFAEDDISFNGSSSLRSGVDGQSNGSEISVKSNNGDIVFLTSLSDPNAVSIASVGAVDGDGGNISVITDNGNIIFGGDQNGGAISSLSGLGENGSGRSGNILVRSNNGNIDFKLREINANIFGSGDGGEIIIEANGGSIILEDTGFFTNTNSATNGGRGGDFTLEATDRIDISGGPSRLGSGTAGSGDGGDLSILAREVKISNGAMIGPSSGGSGNAGNVTISASELLEINYAGVGTGAGGSGNGGNIKIDVGNLQMSNRAFLDSSTSGSGSGGNINLQVNGSATLNDTILNTGTSNTGNGGSITIDANENITIGQSDKEGKQTQLLSSSGTQDCLENLCSGNGGNITLSGSTLLITDQTLVSAATVGAGNGGTIEIQDTDSFILDSASSLNVSTTSSGGGGSIIIRDTDNVEVGGGTQINTSTSGTGNGGLVNFEGTGSVTIHEGAEINSGTSGLGNGGNITILASETLSLGNEELGGNETKIISSSGNQIGCADGQCEGGTITLSGATVALNNDLEVSAGTVGSGNGGQIIFENSNELNIDSASDLNVSTSSSGDGGNITVRNIEDVLIAGNADINTSTSGSGNGGAVSITDTDSINIGDGAEINSGTTGLGNGGNITLRARETLSLGNESSGGSETQIISSSGDQTGCTGGQCEGGTITLAGATISLNNDLEVNAETEGSGAGGAIIFKDSTQLNINSDLNVSTSGSGDGGNILIRDVQDVLIANDAAINTSTSSIGNGGNIDISANNSINVSDRASLDSSTTSFGSGGDVTFSAPTVSLSDGALVTAATSNSGMGGTLKIHNTGDVEIVGPETQLNTSTSGTGRGGEIEILANSSITVSDRASLDASTTGAGKGGGITLSGSTVSLADEASVTAETQASGNGGNVSIVDSDEVLIENNSNITALSSGDGGNAGNVDINADIRFFLSDNSQVDVSSLGSNNAGSLELNSPSVLVDRGSKLNASNIAGESSNIDINEANLLRVSNNSEISASTDSGKAGNVNIDTSQLDIVNNSSITASNESGSSGNINLQGINSLRLNNESKILASTRTGTAGNLLINIDSVPADDISLGNQSRLVVAANGEEGVAGRIEINARDLALEEQSRISASNISESSGNVSIRNLQNLSLDDKSSISASTETGTAGNLLINSDSVPADDIRLGNQSRLVVAATEEDGNAGRILINSENVELKEQSRVLASNVSGISGNILLQNLQSLSLDGRSRFAASTNTGTAGNLLINLDSVPADDIRLGNQSRLVVAANGEEGIAGRILVNSENIGLREKSRVLASNISGDSGNISLQNLRSLSLDGRSRFAAATETGIAGNLIINRDSNPVDDIRLANQSRLVVAATDKGGKAGSVFINARNVELEEQSRILASNISNISRSISLQNLQSLLLDSRSNISASTETGSAGNLLINHEASPSENIYLEDQSSLVVTANDEGGSAGRITINSRNIELEGNSQILASNISDDTEKIRNISFQNIDFLRLDGKSEIAASTQTGQAGNLFIDSPNPELGNISLNNASRLTVEAEATNGTAGDITTNVQSISLDNEAGIVATAVRGTGGDINLTATDSLFMRRGSQISALSTGQNSEDGNISIDTDVIVSVLSENNDIIARSSNQGDINLENVEGILGFQVQEVLNPSPFSDITATGTVFLNPDLTDPTQGLEQLPTEPRDIEVNNQCRVASNDDPVSYQELGSGGQSDTPGSDRDASVLDDDWIEIGSESTETMAETDSSTYEAFRDSVPTNSGCQG
ncbi:MAG: filamentous hemagglutinin N-terminal domain-containing protein [Cyanobacteria bacterium P01_F01_bin.150]